MSCLAATPKVLTFAPALGRGSGSGTEAIPTVVAGGSPEDHTESTQETHKKRSAVTRMYLQGHLLQTLFRLSCCSDGVRRILGSLLCSQSSF